MAAKKNTKKKAAPKHAATGRPQHLIKRRPKKISNAALAKELLDSRAPADIRRLLREERKRLLERKKEALQEARAQCKKARAQTKKRRQLQRERLLKLWARAQALELEKHARTCARQREVIALTYAEGREQNRALAEAVRREKAERRELKKKHKSPAELKRALREKERKGEALDEARNEVQTIAPSLMPYFEQVRTSLRKRPNKSIAESFFQMAEENPDEVILARQKKAERMVAKLIEEGEDEWRQRHQRIEGRICERATKAAKAGRLFQLKSSEEKALEAVGVNPGKLMNECYNRNVKRRRIVSRSLPEAPF